MYARAAGDPTTHGVQDLALRGRQTLEKAKQILKRVRGSGTLSGSRTQVQSNSCFRASAKPPPTAPDTPRLAELRTIVTSSEKGLLRVPSVDALYDNDVEQRPAAGSVSGVPQEPDGSTRHH